MSVLLETSLGDITIDLLPEFAPKSCANFLKLCKIKYYNYSPVHSVQPDFSFQTGDPIGPGFEGSDGGSSIWGVINGPSKKTFLPEFNEKLKHTERGTVSFATTTTKNDPKQREAGSQFLITLGDRLEHLDGKAAIFGHVVEGFDVLENISSAFLDDNGWPLKDIRIRHTIVLDEADIPDPDGLIEPPESPVPTAAQLATVRIADDEELKEDEDQESLEKLRRQREAQAQALTLEMVGDLPFAEVAPPENVLFVCKLNPVTQEEDLELIFSRFGKVLSCEVIRDKQTGDSLQYAFIEFSEQKSCEQAYFKMQDVLIDDHRIHVDFSQSVSRLADVWRKDTETARGRKRGGFGGVDMLEKKRLYRGDDPDSEPKSKYTMVHDTRKDSRPRDDEYSKRRTGPREGHGRRSRSPPRRRSRSRERYKSSQDERHRDRDRDRHRHERHREHRR